MKEKIYIVKEHICSGESEFTAAGKARIDVEDILYDWKAKDRGIMGRAFLFYHRLKLRKIQMKIVF